MSQYKGEYEAKYSRMEAYLELVKKFVQQFDAFDLVRIPRGENTMADALAALASTSDLTLKRRILVDCIEAQSINTGKKLWL